MGRDMCFIVSYDPGSTATSLRALMDNEEGLLSQESKSQEDTQSPSPSILSSSPTMAENAAVESIVSAEAEAGEQREPNQYSNVSPLKKPKLADKHDASVATTPSNETDSGTPDITTPPESGNTENKPQLIVSPLHRSASDLTAAMERVAEETCRLVNNVGPTWFKALENQFSEDYFVSLSKFLAQERKKSKIFPPADQVFSWTKACDISKVKVVILGQDPYYNDRQAHGFAFSVQKGITPPPSLVNMYKELADDIPGFTRPDHGDLTGWATQGVLLLNAVLTVQAHQPNSHKDRGWEKFTDSVISYISNNVNNVVFMLWGAYAQKKGAQIKKNKHLVLQGPHPSPWSARRGFFGCKHFSKANEYLKTHRRNPIDWTQL